MEYVIIMTIIRAIEKGSRPVRDTRDYCVTILRERFSREFFEHVSKSTNTWPINTRQDMDEYVTGV